MKKYNVNVNGTKYEVTIEEIDASSVAVAPAVAEAPKAEATPAPAAAPAPAATAGGETVKCPMPGSILSVNVNVGDAVKRGQVLVILEAMKMENEITAPCDGTIASVGVTKGSTVESGAVICTIA